MSPKEFVSEFRLKKACMYLENDSCTIAEVAYRTGFNDPVYFTRLFKQKRKDPPNTGKVVAKQKNEQLAFHSLTQYL